MIRGAVNEFRQVVIPLSARDDHGRQHDLSASLDTGFSGFITLPPQVIQTLQLAFLEPGYYALGDGSEVELSLFRAIVSWDGQDRIVLAVEADDDPLVGMEMVDGSMVFLDATIGGEVRIEVRTGE